MPTAHVHPRALSALLALVGEDKIRVSDRAGMSPGHLRDLETFRNKGLSLAIRERVADAFRRPTIDAASITCWCDRPNGTCRSLLPENAGDR